MATILRASGMTSKRAFNPTNKTDLELAKGFLRSKSWGSAGCPFLCEFPHLSVPDMIKERLLNTYVLNK